MIHSTYLGFFDHAAAGKCELVVRVPLDVHRASRLLLNAADRIDENGIAYIDRDRFAVYDGYVRIFDFVRSERAAYFVTVLATEMNCEILFLECNQFDTPQKFLEKFETMSRHRAHRRDRARRIREAPSHAELIPIKEQFRQAKLQ